MIDRLIPLFAIIGVVSSIGYLYVIAYVLYNTWGHLAPAAVKRAKQNAKDMPDTHNNNAVSRISSEKGKWSKKRQQHPHN